MIRIDCDTDTTGKPVCLATRSAVRCRVPVSTVGIDGSGIRWTAARTMRVHVPVDDDRAVHLGELAQPGRGELDVEGEPAGAQTFHRAVVAEDDERSRTPSEDTLEPVAQRGTRRDRGERGPELRVRALVTCSHNSPGMVSLLGSKVYGPEIRDAPRAMRCFPAGNRPIGRQSRHGQPPGLLDVTACGRCGATWV